MVKTSYAAIVCRNNTQPLTYKLLVLKQNQQLMMEVLPCMPEIELTALNDHVATLTDNSFLSTSKQNFTQKYLLFFNYATKHFITLVIAIVSNGSTALFIQQNSVVWSTRNLDLNMELLTNLLQACILN